MTFEVCTGGLTPSGPSQQGRSSQELALCSVDSFAAPYVLDRFLHGSLHRLSHHLLHRVLDIPVEHVFASPRHGFSAPASHGRLWIKFLREDLNRLLCSFC
jgi:hypothetical protein